MYYHMHHGMIMFSRQNAVAMALESRSALSRNYVLNLWAQRVNWKDISWEINCVNIYSIISIWKEYRIMYDHCFVTNYKMVSFELALSVTRRSHLCTPLASSITQIPSKWLCMQPARNRKQNHRPAQCVIGRCRAVSVPIAAKLLLV